MERLYTLFTRHAIEDQINFYQGALVKHRAAARQVRFIRASLSLLTGVASAIAGLLALSRLTSPNDPLTIGLAISTVVFPALAAAFNILADLYQWDRLTAIYDTSEKAMQVAEALKPRPAMDDETYRISLTAMAQSTLNVMSDETAQWGQLIRPPQTLEQFVEQEKRIAEQYSKSPENKKPPTDTT
jgi:hypothetical protein